MLGHEGEYMLSWNDVAIHEVVESLSKSAAIMN
jgi:hypothetical protein